MKHSTLNNTYESTFWSQQNQFNNLADSVIELVPRECHRCNPPWTPSASHSLFPSASPLPRRWNSPWTSVHRNDRRSPSPIPDKHGKTEEKTKTLNPKPGSFSNPKQSRCRACESGMRRESKREWKQRLMDFSRESDRK